MKTTDWLYKNKGYCPFWKFRAKIVGVMAVTCYRSRTYVKMSAPNRTNFNWCRSIDHSRYLTRENSFSKKDHCMSSVLREAQYDTNNMDQTPAGFKANDILFFSIRSLTWRRITLRTQCITQRSKFSLLNTWFQPKAFFNYSSPTLFIFKFKFRSQKTSWESRIQTCRLSYSSL